MENIFFLVLLAVVGLVRWLSQMAENKRNAEAERQAGQPSAPRSETFSRPPAQSEEERIRRFMEALGVPTTSAPPPKVQPRPAEPKAAQPDRKFMPVDPFPVPRARPAEQRPPVVVAPPPIAEIPPAPVAPPPLPTRETTTPAEPVRQAFPRRAGSAEFEVEDLDAAAAQDLSAPTRRALKAPAEELGVAARLANRQGLRDAIVLREIFGPPRSMQPLDPAR